MAARIRGRPGRRAERADVGPFADGLPPLLTGGVALAALGALSYLERRRPLRPQRTPRARRQARNLAIAAGSALTVHLLERPLVGPAARRARDERVGWIRRLGLPGWLELPLVVLALDYTLFLWHRLTHHVPFLWRFHAAHHADRDMDSTTALRFHWVEMGLSAPWRWAQVRCLGATPLALTSWQLFTLLEILFHHSNWRLPRALERRLELVLTTPRMHGVHHSLDARERDSNFSNGISLWDRLHGTWIPASDLADGAEVGLPDWRGAEELTLREVLVRPLRAGQRRRGSERRSSGRVVSPGSKVANAP